MSSFISAMNSPLLTKKGINDSDVYTEEGVGDLRVSLFQMLVRNCESSYIFDVIMKASHEHFRDFFVMAFQTRDIRGGKGERDIFYVMILSLLVRIPELCEPMIKLIPV